MSTSGKYISRDRVCALAALAAIAAGFYWRVAYLRQISPHIDEFTTMLAAQMIVQKGVPQLPSGLFYDTGLLFNYVVAAFVGPAGFTEFVARFPSVIFGLLSVAVTYRLGRRFFSPAVALLAAALLALAPDAVGWGARSRPYAQLQFYVLVGVWALAEGFSGRWKGRWRAVFWLAMAAAALSHLAGIIFMLCLLATALPARLLWAREEQQGRADLSRQIRSLWPDGLLAVALLGGMAAITMAGQPAWIEPTTGSSEVTGSISLSALVHVDWMGAVYMAGPILLRLYYVPWTFLLLVNLIGLLYRAISRQLRQVDAILLYLHGTSILSVLTLTVVSPWHLPRYIFPLLPIFFLLGSYEMANIARNLARVLFPKRTVGSGWLAEVTLVLLSLYLWIPLRQLTIGQQYGYDLAFHYVQDRWHEEDAVMAFNTMASYLYLGQCDYYPTQIRPWLLDTPAGQVERYSGAEWIQSVDQLENALARSPRTWYVIDEERFADRVSPEMQRAILDRFQLVSQERGVKVFLYGEE